jgi:hypothetical protein
MRVSRSVFTAAALVVFGTSQVLAQGKSGSAPKGGAPKATSPSPAGGSTMGNGGGNAGGAPKATGPSTIVSQAGHGGGPKTTTTTTTANAPTTSTGPGLANGKRAGAPATAAGTGSTSGSTTGSGSGSGTTAGAGTTGTTGTGTTTGQLVALPNPISTKIAKNPQQLARVSAMLPEGMTLEQASTGFRNQGQFLAALNVSKNRGLPFVDLQKAMTVDGLSLGQAAKQMQPTPVTPPTTGTGGTTGPGGTTP